MKKSFGRLNFPDENIKKSIIFVLSCLFTFMVLISSIAPQKYDLEIGQISNVTIKAQYNVSDKITTERLREEAAKGVEDIIVFDEKVLKDTYNDIEQLFSIVIRVNRDIYLSEDEIQRLEQNEAAIEKEQMDKKIQAFNELSGVMLADEDVNLLLSISVKEANDLKAFIQESMDKLQKTVLLNETEDKVTGKKILNTDDQVYAQQVLEGFFSNSLFANAKKELGKSICFKMLRPNVVFDEKKTEENKEIARNSIEEVVIRKGQHIVQDGSLIDEAQMAILGEMGVLDGKTSMYGIRVLSTLLVAVIIIVLQWLFIYRYEKDIYMSDKMLILISTINIISLTLSRGITIISPFIIPVTLAPLLMGLLLKDNLAITLSVLNSILILIITGANIPLSCVIVVNGILGVTFLKNMEQRNDILISTIYIAMTNVAIFGLAQMMIGEVEYVKILVNCLFIALGTVFSGILSIGLLPFLESFFDIVTNVKLLELSNPNHPLLKRLVMEAPGTYHHSVLVGNLSEMAAQAVKANSVIARVGAFYHDIGKIKRPIFFKENQKGENPHDNITPNLSTLIITSHVKDGLELAKEYKIPMAIKDIIVQHHGTSVVKYFYITMKNNSENPDDVREEDFAYPGPIPNSKEAAIVMLADSVEAAVRSINDPTKEKIDEMVSKIIKGRLNEGQLDNCDLTLKDLTKIKEAFLKGLAGIYHQRIEYPKLVKDKKKALLAGDGDGRK